MEFGRGMDSVQAVKSLPVTLSGPRPIDEAISTAGGVARAAVTDDLELRAVPKVFVCGEMLDWEAPTGGYLLTACWSTGRWAGRAAAQVS
jgi:predicted flavoprotein YhiN